jgi:hypothetical protein
MAFELTARGERESNFRRLPFESVAKRMRRSLPLPSLPLSAAAANGTTSAASEPAMIAQRVSLDMVISS